MNNVIDIQERIRIEEDASLWIAKIDRALTAEEEGEFKHWLTSRKEHYSLFMEMAAHWDNTEWLKQLQGSYSSHLAKKPRNILRYSVAACVLFTSMIFVTKLFDNFYFSVRYSERYTTQNSTVTKIPLPDGSQLTLNARSTVKIKFTDSIREIALSEGELYIDVAHDANRPLVVAVNNQRIKAVGTAFNVNQLTQKIIEVTVTEGTVSYQNSSIFFVNTESNRNSKLIKAGQQGMIGDDIDRVKEASKEELNRATSWRQGFLIFNGQSLKEVLRDMERYSEYKFKLSPTLENTKIVGYFKAGDTKTFLAALEENFNIRHKIENKNIVVLFPGELSSKTP